MDTLTSQASPRSLCEGAFHVTPLHECAPFQIVSPQTPPILVLGLGNPLLGDDAIGWIVAEQVKQQVESEGAKVEVDCVAVGGIGLMERCVGYAHVILIDSVFTGRQPPGHLYSLSVDDLPASGLGHLGSTHDATLQTAFSVGRDLRLPLPNTISIVGIEAERVFDFTEELTPAIAAAVPHFVDKVIECLYRFFQEECPKMISPELLLRHPFFGALTDAQLKAIAMLSNEEYCTAGDTLFRMGDPANTFYFLLEGSIDLHYFVTDQATPNLRKDFYVGHVNPGEPFGISGLIEPYQYTSTALANASGRILTLEANALRALCQADKELAATLMQQVAKAALSRLNETRVQLAATQVP